MTNSSANIWLKTKALAGAPTPAASGYIQRTRGSLEHSSSRADVHLKSNVQEASGAAASAGSSLSLSWVPQPLLKELKLVKELWALSSQCQCPGLVHTGRQCPSTTGTDLKDQFQTPCAWISRTDPTGASRHHHPAKNHRLGLKVLGKKMWGLEPVPGNCWGSPEIRDCPFGSGKHPNSPALAEVTGVGTSWSLRSLPDQAFLWF